MYLNKQGVSDIHMILFLIETYCNDVWELSTTNKAWNARCHKLGFK
jgi:hypothetical protein